MLSRGTRPPRASRALRWSTAALAVIGLIFGTASTATAADGSMVPAVTQTAAQTGSGEAATKIVKQSLTGFSPSNIISDAVFTDSSTMTEAQIQAFFDSKVATCRGGSDQYGPIICLKSFKTDSVNRPADQYCSGYTGAKGESAARIIYRVSQACGINPQVLIVMLQKEQGLVTHTWPSAWRYDAALGQGCPDDAPCNPAYVGFFHQIYGAARQMQTYLEGRYFTWYAPGKTWNILYHPNRGCGTAPVPVKNAATSALYYYTPYQPNAAALKAGYGTGDSCSSYGNRNFYNYFTDWFGSTQEVVRKKFALGQVSVAGKHLVGQKLTASVKVDPAPASTSYQWLRDGAAIAGAVRADYTVAQADIGKSLSARVTVKKAGYDDASAASAAVKVSDVRVQRLSGPKRESTAIAVSRAAWPKGAETVMLATSGDFPDALSAAAAAGKASASLLLTPKGALPADVAAEIKRLQPSRVVLVGGEGVLSKAVQSQVGKAAPGAAIERLDGANRYETSRAAALMGGTSAQVLIATGRDFPDAISAASAGNSTAVPVLLVDGMRNELDAATLDTLGKLKATSATVVGGDGVVRAGIVAHLKRQGISVTRLAGADRFATNDAVARKYSGTSASQAILASGMNFPDALTASVLAGKWQAPMLLTRQTCMSSKAADLIRQSPTETVTLVGGAGVLPDGILRSRTC